MSKHVNEMKDTRKARESNIYKTSPIPAPQTNYEDLTCWPVSVDGISSDVDRISEVRISDIELGPRSSSCNSSCSSSTRWVQSMNPPQHSDPRLGLRVIVSRENGGPGGALLSLESAED